MDWLSVPVVDVEWVDSHSLGGWEPLEDLRARITKPGRLLCRSIGWLIHEDDEILALAQSQNFLGHVSDGMQIPKVAVRKVTVVVPASIANAETKKAGKRA